MLPPKEGLLALAAFMAERHAIYMRKAYLSETTEAYRQTGAMSAKMRQAWQVRADGTVAVAYDPRRWSLDHLTDDPILARYRFCNVYRELDRVTVWIRENIREPFADDEHLWFMLAVARHINWPPTLQRLIECQDERGDGIGSWPAPLPEAFRPESMTRILMHRQEQGEKVYTGAYMIRAEQHDHPWRYWPKVRYSAEIVLGRLWEHRHDWQNLNGPGVDTLQGIWEYFQLPVFVGWGPFMAQQVVADMRHTRYLRDAPDAGNWTSVGPGSARGLNRLHGRKLTGPVAQEQGLAEMRAIRQAFLETIPLAPWLDVPELSDVQNCLCEFDKYERTRLGEGRPRATYVPGRGG